MGVLPGQAGAVPLPGPLGLHTLYRVRCGPLRLPAPHGHQGRLRRAVLLDQLVVRGRRLRHWVRRGLRLELFPVVGVVLRLVQVRMLGLLGGQVPPLGELDHLGLGMVVGLLLRDGLTLRADGAPQEVVRVQAGAGEVSVAGSAARGETLVGM